MRIILACVLAIAALLGASTSKAQPAPGPFYDAGGLSLGPPGTLLRLEPLEWAPGGASAFRMLYSSTDLNGRAIPVSGLVVIPPGPAAAAGRDIVAWAHGTVGVARHCAPSLLRGALDRILGLPDLLAQGVIVAATDYPGLGAAGPPAYLVGSNEARAVIDSVRAARNVQGAQASSRFAVWGHSQGGHAALFTGQLAASYAPELTLTGIAASEPPTELGRLLRDIYATAIGKLILADTLWSWSQVYGAPLANAILPQAEPAMEAAVAGCSEGILDDIGLLLDMRPLREGFLREDLTAIPPWDGLIARNSPSNASPGVPLFIVRGTADRIVRPDVTSAFIGRLCANGATVRVLDLPGAGHNEAGRLAAPYAAQWIAERFSGAPAPNDCGPR